MCKYITETVTFTSTVTEDTFKIKNRFDCNDKCLAYLMTRSKCKKQHAGQTTDHIHSRWNNYRRFFDRGEECMQEHFYKNFERQCHSGFRDDVSVIIIDKTDGSNPAKRDTYWMRILTTIALYDLNI